MKKPCIKNKQAINPVGNGSYSFASCFFEGWSKCQLICEVIKTVNYTTPSKDIVSFFFEAFFSVALSDVDLTSGR